MSDHRKVALITPSYRDDFERCRLLCDSIDAFVEDKPDHYLLVEGSDFDMFMELQGPKRHIINESDILPHWLHSIRQGLSASSKRLWFSSRTWPMRGWHVQQLRRIAIAHHIPHAGLLYCDSDMLFVRPFSTGQLWQGADLRLYRKSDGIHDGLPENGSLHKRWTSGAARLFELPQPDFPAHDYINNLVSWRRTQVVEMCHRIEEVSGKHWVAAIGSERSFSECQIYGAFADDVLAGEGHWSTQQALCKTYWSGDALTAQSVAGFVETMEDDQVAIGIQSFTGTDPALLRQLVRG